MKKFIAFSIVFTLLSAAVFAEFTVNGSAATLFVPIGAVIPDAGDTEIGAGLGRNGSDHTQLYLNFVGTTESGKAGFRFEWYPRLLGGNLNLTGMGDFAGLWVKPADWIRIDAGKFVNNDIRGRLGSGAWFGDYAVPRPGEGEIFTNFSTNAGIMAALTPSAVNGLGVYVAVKNINYINNTDTSQASTVGRDGTWGVNRGIAYVYENTQAAVSYAIPNIGLVRAQYVGAHPAAAAKDETKILPSGIWAITAPQIQAAFAFTGVPNLTVDVGGKYSLPVTDPKTETTSGLLGAAQPDPAGPAGKYLDNGVEKKGTFKAPIAVGLGVKYVAGNLTATAIVDGKFAGSYKEDGTEAIDLGMELRPWVTVNYKLNDTFTVQGEGGIVYAGDSEQDGRVLATGGVRYGFGGYLQANIGSSSYYVRTGVSYAGGEGVGNSTKAKKLDGIFNVPVLFSVSF
jgi:hypothetical protein